jgi:hypothetical protein
LAEDEKGMFLSFELMARVGQPATSTKYKKQVRKFEERTPQQWIHLLLDLQEIWTQNSVNGGTDRASTVRLVVKGESITTFELSLQEARTGEKYTVLVEQSGSGRHGRGGRNTRDSFGIRARNVLANFLINKTSKMY